ncbi:MAG: DUF4925 domain-containing protein [Bacteroides sp.]|nr:DUF4925 domain-containing protein [Bacteroides sp.]
MKKNLFYLFALICSMSLFTACSDDDELWKDLPKGELVSDKTEIELNGEATDGQVSFTAISSEAAQVGLKNVIDGYSDVQVDVVMEAQADGSFAFSGRKELVTKPVTRVDATPAPFLVVELNGTIAKTGAATLNIKTSGLGLSLGTYAAETLVLTYNGTVQNGKTVVVDATAGDNASFLLQGVVPGEDEAILENIAYSNDTFQGTAETGLYTIKVSGKRENKVLSLNLTATLKEALQGGLAGTWKLSTDIAYYDDDTWESVMLPTSAVHFVWSALDDSQMNGQQLANLGTLFGSHILGEVLSDITLEADGNLTAAYYSGINTSMMRDGTTGEWVETQKYLEESGMGDYYDETTMWMMTKLGSYSVDIYPRDWQRSPKDLVYWYVRDGYFYVIPNVARIIEQALADKGENIDVTPILEIIRSLETATDEQLMQMVGMLGQLLPGVDLSAIDVKTVRVILGWLKTGVPLKYTAENGVLNLYIDKEMARPFMDIVISFLPMLQQEFDKLAAENPMMGFVTMLLGIQKFEDLGTIWKNNTDEFTLGINFKTENSEKAARNAMHVGGMNNLQQTFDTLLRKFDKTQVGNE